MNTLLEAYVEENRRLAADFTGAVSENKRLKGRIAELEKELAKIKAPAVGWYWVHRKGDPYGKIVGYAHPGQGGWLFSGNTTVYEWGTYVIIEGPIAPPPQCMVDDEPVPED